MNAGTEPGGPAPLILAPAGALLVVDLSGPFWAIASGDIRNEKAIPSIVAHDIGQIAIGGYLRKAIALDTRGTPLRSSFWPKYKADREVRPEARYKLLDETAALLASRGYRVFRAPATQGGFFEADDVIASIVAWARGRRIPVDIYGGDSDLAALVSDEDHVRLLRRYRGVTPLDERAVEEWQGVRPAWIAAVKALAGDRGDGYGDTFPGIGKDKAIRLLSAAGGDARRAVEFALEPERKGAEFAALRRAVDAIAPGATDPDARRAAARERTEIALALSGLRADVPLDGLDALLDDGRRNPPASSTRASAERGAARGAPPPAGSSSSLPGSATASSSSSPIKPGEFADDMAAQGMASAALFGMVFSPPHPHHCPGCCVCPEPPKLSTEKATLECAASYRKLFDRWHAIDRKWQARGEPSACPVLQRGALSACSAGR